MSWRFSLEAANLVGYLTAPKRLRYAKGVPPRVTSSQLRNFFESLSRGDGLLSNREQWLGAIRATADDCLRELNRISTNRDVAVEGEADDGPLPDAAVETLITQLKPLFEGYALYGLAIGGSKDWDALWKFTQHAGRSSGPNGLFLIPESLSDRAANLVLDPFAGLEVVGHLPDVIPGIVFWLPSGKVHFFNLEDSHLAYSEVHARWKRRGFLTTVSALHGKSQAAEAALEAGQALNLLAHERYWKGGGAGKIVHLSDLHFGDNAGWRAKVFLLAHLQKRELQGRAVPVITGDLIDTPADAAIDMFEEFRFAGRTKGDFMPIVVPGNHDQKWMGLSFGPFGKNDRLIRNLDWSPLVVDHATKSVFLCFDSARDIGFANGQIDVHQRQQVALELEECCDKNREVNSYFRVALIHHHPFSFDTRAETWIQKGLRYLGIGDERFLAMTDSEAFVQWCADRGVDAILHGHKHVPRYAYRDVVRAGDMTRRRVWAIGCGSSLGAGGSDLRFNVITRDLSTGAWAVRFMKCAPDLGGFYQEAVALHPA